MAQTNAELSNKISGARFEQLAVQEQLQKWKDSHLDKLSALSGNRDTAEKIFVICMNTIGKNPALMTCAFESIANCILQSFQLNLFPGPFQECSYVPLENGRLSKQAGRTIKEANFWPQYQGLVKLLRNAGNKSIIARVVCVNDLFEYSEGDAPPRYVPAVCLGKERGAARFVYAAICSAQGSWQVEVMDLKQIETIKNRSRGAKTPDSPWNSKYIDDQYTMFAKTCLKRVSKWCTKSSELVTAIEHDNLIDGDPSYSKVSILNTNLVDNVPPLAGAQEDDSPPAISHDEQPYVDLKDIKPADSVINKSGSVGK